MITINLEKAKQIAHEIRKNKRAKEFAPYDEVIMKQIPGNDLTEAETARSQIRLKYENMQLAIDTATTAEQIKTALEGVE
jgi:hypothetical protein